MRRDSLYAWERKFVKEEKKKLTVLLLNLSCFRWGSTRYRAAAAIIEGKKCKELTSSNARSMICRSKSFSRASSSSSSLFFDCWFSSFLLVSWSLLLDRVLLPPFFRRSYILSQYLRIGSSEREEEGKSASSTLIMYHTLFPFLFLIEILSKLYSIRSSWYFPFSLKIEVQVWKEIYKIVLSNVPITPFTGRWWR